jgi:uncharacterized membrane protein
VIQEVAGPVSLPQSAAYTDIARWATAVIEVAGIGAIVVGAAIGTIAFVRDLVTKTTLDDAYRRYRVGLGRSILLGLEFLVAADIIHTVAIEPSFRSVGILAIVVLIRTFLSFALSAEIEGRLPWRRSGRPQ